MNWKEWWDRKKYQLRDSFRYRPTTYVEFRIIRALRPFGRFLAKFWRFLTKIHILVVVIGYALLIVGVYMYVKNPDIQESLLGCPRSNISQVADSVVMVTGDVGIGSGYWFDQNTVITNNHVVDHNPNLTVNESNRTGYPVEAVELLATDSLRDIAILKVNNASSHYVPKISKMIPSIADQVYAIGYPQGKNLTVTEGIISAFTQDDYDDRGYIQTDAAINQGNSGGILVDNCGRLLGMNTQTLQGAQNIGYAIGIDQVSQKVNEMLAAVKDATPQERESSYPSEQTEVVARYYTTISKGDFTGAYNYYSSARRARVEFNGWASGLSSTLSVRLESVAQTGSANTVEVRFYTWEQKEDSYWEYTTREFGGTWTLTREKGLWKMDESNIKLIKTFE